MSEWQAAQLKKDSATAVQELRERPVPPARTQGFPSVPTERIRQGCFHFACFEEGGVGENLVKVSPVPPPEIVGEPSPAMFIEFNEVTLVLGVDDLNA